uniref:Uncharacterized protein n=1 Tax=Chromera velia CCMP2878 TaxID=1169474 RepID=A0A0G4HY10_9ALVE|eukprot:Cvel_1507.t1-p1 / transcript=Cvel_1507.t1 / gene=Cvel_1507 / organism=Chromera_velia_CCMP2878 / gene_product=hypothetical protein / transcript_product=hypothetical protein / location=Cvel_scaffold53:22183-37862(-) / protein_length=3176 / sequence_SO=supercontig / SO=protein_coding / is_pseudo=false
MTNILPVHFLRILLGPATGANINVHVEVEGESGQLTNAAKAEGLSQLILELGKVPKETARASFQPVEETLNRLVLQAPMGMLCRRVATLLSRLYTAGDSLHRLSATAGTLLQTATASSSKLPPAVRASALDVIAELFVPHGPLLGGYMQECLVSVNKQLKVQETALRVRAVAAMATCVEAGAAGGPAVGGEVWKAAVKALQDKSAVVRQTGHRCLSALFKNSPVCVVTLFDAAVEKLVRCVWEEENTACRQSLAETLATFLAVASAVSVDLPGATQAASGSAAWFGVGSGGGGGGGAGGRRKKARAVHSLATARGFLLAQLAKTAHANAPAPSAVPGGLGGVREVLFSAYGSLHILRDVTSPVQISDSVRALLELLGGHLPGGEGIKVERGLSGGSSGSGLAGVWGSTVDGLHLMNCVCHCVRRMVRFLCRTDTALKHLTEKCFLLSVRTFAQKQEKETSKTESAVAANDLFDTEEAERERERKTPLQVAAALDGLVFSCHLAGGLVSGFEIQPHEPALHALAAAKSDSSGLIQLHAAFALRVVARANPSALCQLISVLLNMVTVDNAELMSVHEAERARVSEAREEHLRSLCGHSFALASLVVEVRGSRLGVPEEVPLAVLGAARALAVAHPNQTVSAQRRAAAFTLVEALTSLGNSSLEAHLGLLFALWKSALGKKALDSLRAVFEFWEAKQQAGTSGQFALSQPELLGGRGRRQSDGFHNFDAMLTPEASLSDELVVLHAALRSLAGFVRGAGPSGRGWKEHRGGLEFVAADGKGAKEELGKDGETSAWCAQFEETAQRVSEGLDDDPAGDGEGGLLRFPHLSHPVVLFASNAQQLLSCMPLPRANAGAAAQHAQAAGSDDPLLAFLKGSLFVTHGQATGGQPAHGQSPIDSLCPLSPPPPDRLGKTVTAEKSNRGSLLVAARAALYELFTGVHPSQMTSLNKSPSATDPPSPTSSGLGDAGPSSIASIAYQAEGPVGHISKGLPTGVTRLLGLLNMSADDVLRPPLSGAFANSLLVSSFLPSEDALLERAEAARDPDCPEVLPVFKGGGSPGPHLTALLGTRSPGASAVAAPVSLSPFYSEVEATGVMSEMLGTSGVHDDSPVFRSAPGDEALWAAVCPQSEFFGECDSVPPSMHTVGARLHPQRFAPLPEAWARGLSGDAPLCAQLAPSEVRFKKGAILVTADILASPLVPGTTRTAVLSFVYKKGRDALAAWQAHKQAQAAALASRSSGGGFLNLVRGANVGGGAGAAGPDMRTERDRAAFLALSHSPFAASACSSDSALCVPLSVACLCVAFLKNMLIQRADAKAAGGASEDLSFLEGPGSAGSSTARRLDKRPRGPSGDSGGGKTEVARLSNGDFEILLRLLCDGAASGHPTVRALFCHALGLLFVLAHAEAGFSAKQAGYQIETPLTPSAGPLIAFDPPTPPRGAAAGQQPQVQQQQRPSPFSMTVAPADIAHAVLHFAAGSSTSQNPALRCAALSVWYSVLRAFSAYAHRVCNTPAGAEGARGGDVGGDSGTAGAEVAVGAVAPPSGYIRAAVGHLLGMGKDTSMPVRALTLHGVGVAMTACSAGFVGFVRDSLRCCNWHLLATPFPKALLSFTVAKAIPRALAIVARKADLMRLSLASFPSAATGGRGAGGRGEKERLLIEVRTESVALASSMLRELRLQLCRGLRGGGGGAVVTALETETLRASAVACRLCHGGADSPENGFELLEAAGGALNSVGPLLRLTAVEILELWQRSASSGDVMASGGAATGGEKGIQAVPPRSYVDRTREMKLDEWLLEAAGTESDGTLLSACRRLIALRLGADLAACSTFGSVPLSQGGGVGKSATEAQREVAAQRWLGLLVGAAHGDGKGARKGVFAGEALEEGKEGGRSQSPGKEGVGFSGGGDAGLGEDDEDEEGGDGGGGGGGGGDGGGDEEGSPPRRGGSDSETGSPGGSPARAGEGGRRRPKSAGKRGREGRDGVDLPGEAAKGALFSVRPPPEDASRLAAVAAAGGNAASVSPLPVASDVRWRGRALSLWALQTALRKAAEKRAPESVDVDAANRAREAAAKEHGLSRRSACRMLHWQEDLLHLATMGVSASIPAVSEEATGLLLWTVRLFRGTRDPKAQISEEEERLDGMRGRPPLLLQAEASLSAACRAALSPEIPPPTAFSALLLLEELVRAKLFTSPKRLLTLLLQPLSDVHSHGGQGQDAHGRRRNSGEGNQRDRHADGTGETGGSQTAAQLRFSTLYAEAESSILYLLRLRICFSLLERQAALHPLLADVDPLDAPSRLPRSLGLSSREAELEAALSEHLRAHWRSLCTHIWLLIKDACTLTAASTAHGQAEQETDALALSQYTLRPVLSPGTSLFSLVPGDASRLAPLYRLMAAPLLSGATSLASMGALSVPPLPELFPSLPSDSLSSSQHAPSGLTLMAAFAIADLALCAPECIACLTGAPLKGEMGGPSRLRGRHAGAAAQLRSALRMRTQLEILTEILSLWSDMDSVEGSGAHEKQKLLREAAGHLWRGPVRALLECGGAVSERGGEDAEKRSKTGSAQRNGSGSSSALVGARSLLCPSLLRALLALSEHAAEAEGEGAGAQGDPSSSSEAPAAAAAQALMLVSLHAVALATNPSTLEETATSLDKIQPRCCEEGAVRLRNAVMQEEWGEKMEVSLLKDAVGLASLWSTAKGAVSGNVAENLVGTGGRRTPRGRGSKIPRLLPLRFASLFRTPFPLQLALWSAGVPSTRGDGTAGQAPPLSIPPTFMQFLLRQWSAVCKHLVGDWGESVGKEERRLRVGLWARAVTSTAGQLEALRGAVERETADKAGGGGGKAARAIAFVFALLVTAVSSHSPIGEEDGEAEEDEEETAALEDVLRVLRRLFGACLLREASPHLNLCGDLKESEGERERWDFLDGASKEVARAFRAPALSSLTSLASNTASLKWIIPLIGDIAGHPLALLPVHMTSGSEEQEGQETDGWGWAVWCACWKGMAKVKPMDDGGSDSLASLQSLLRVAALVLRGLSQLAVLKAEGPVGEGVEALAGGFQTSLVVEGPPSEAASSGVGVAASSANRGGGMKAAVRAMASAVAAAGQADPQTFRTSVASLEPENRVAIESLIRALAAAGGGGGGATQKGTFAGTSGGTSQGVVGRGEQGVVAPEGSAKGEGEGSGSIQGPPPSSNKIELKLKF